MSPPAPLPVLKGTVNVNSSILTAPRVRPAGRAATAAPAVPWHVYAVLFATTSVVVGVLWDISWHSSIGRDTFWSPPHLAIYLGGVVAGVACGWHVLHTTFAGTPEERATAVGWWWRFRGALGAWACIWGTFAMLASAPFDDWWHNAYGLDVKILSPPHTVLALGILAIQLGAMFMVLALQNRSGEHRAFRWMFACAAGLVLINFAIMATEYTFRIRQHGVLFYQVSALLFPVVLAAAAVAGRLRWPATATAAVYMGTLLFLIWIFPLFPAEPRLAPVRFPLRQMTPPQFPLLLIIPAVAFDLVLHRWGGRPRGWLLAMVLGAAFLLPFFAAQWPFADWLMSPAARTPFTGQHLRPYFVGEDAYSVRGVFYNPSSGTELVKGLAIALGIGVLSARLGIGWGNWMARVRR
ncbi:MAG TPA: hypothetical protein VHG28_11430 [Longimicrobiaceae bacterium]|nr:hypothetical protein [Longimicrobiaceae bacterium]